MRVKDRMTCITICALFASCHTLRVADAQKESTKKAAGDFTELVEKTVDSLPESLSSKEKIEGFVRRIDRIIEIRVRENFRGYERDSKFQSGFEELSEKTLKTATPESIKRIDPAKLRPFKKEAVQALRRNQEELKAFYDKFVKEDRELGKLSEEAITRDLIAFSAILYDRDQESWNRARKRTYSWPICVVLSDEPTRSDRDKD